MTRRTKRRALSSFAVLFGAATLVALGCTGSLITPPPQCTGTGCSCDEDPLQPLCKGFNNRPDGQIDMTDATKVDANDGSEPDTGTTPDTGTDGPDEAGDGGDEAG
jgi:hypothetical protein